MLKVNKYIYGLLNPIGFLLLLTRENHFLTVPCDVSWCQLWRANFNIELCYRMKDSFLWGEICYLFSSAVFEGKLFALFWWNKSTKRMILINTFQGEGNVASRSVYILKISQVSSFRIISREPKAQFKIFEIKFIGGKYIIEHATLWSFPSVE